MLSPVLLARLRRHRVAIGLILLLALFQLGTLFWFEPTARRYERAVRRLGDVGLGGPTVGASHVLPPRLYKLMAENARPAAELSDASSGGLPSSLLATATRLMTESGVEVIATDPGTVIQSPRVTQVRVELRVRARYAGLVSFLDRLGHSGKLIQVERLNLVSDTPERVEAEIALSQYIFKTGAVSQ